MMDVPSLVLLMQTYCFFALLIAVTIALTHVVHM